MYDLIGKPLGKYQIIELQHQTAVTEVYKGFNPATNRYVLVNVLKADFIANEVILKRFLEQNDIAAKVQHPNLLPLIDFGEENGIYFRVLMYGTEGNWQDNKQWLNSNQAILTLFSQLSSALAHIHGFGYAFLNVNPMNIFYGDQRKPMLGDFGIALSQVWSQTNPYCSPEARRNETVDHRSDIYAMGVLLYEVLTGFPPDMNRYVALKTHRPDLPQDVEKVILKALSDRPEDRFQSVNTFQAALKAAFRYTPPSTDATPVQADQAPKKRKVWWIVLVTALIVLCLGAVAVFALSRPDEDSPADQPSIEETVEAPTAPEDEVVIAPTNPAPGEEGSNRPGWQFPDIDLPDLSEIPICNSIYPAVGLGMIGLIAIKTKRNTKSKDEDHIDEW